MAFFLHEDYKKRVMKSRSGFILSLITIVCIAILLSASFALPGTSHAAAPQFTSISIGATFTYPPGFKYQEGSYVAYANADGSVFATNGAPPGAIYFQGCCFAEA